MFLKFFGNGSAFNVSRGNNAAFYKEDDKVLFLDFGENIFERVLKTNLLEGVKEVYIAITHLHTDHAGSLPSFVYYNFYRKGITSHLVGGWASKDNEIKKFLSICGVKQCYYRWCESDLNNAFKNISSLNFIPVNHTDEVEDCSSIKLQLSDGRKIFYSGDTNDQEYIKKVVNNLQEKDEFYCDSCLADYPGNVHMNIDLLAGLIPVEKRGQVYCMHIDNEKLLEKIDSYGFNEASLDFEFEKENF